MISNEQRTEDLSIAGVDVTATKPYKDVWKTGPDGKPMKVRISSEFLGVQATFGMMGNRPFTTKSQIQEKWKKFAMALAISANSFSSIVDGHVTLPSRDGNEVVAVPVVNALAILSLADSSELIDRIDNGLSAECLCEKAEEHIRNNLDTAGSIYRSERSTNIADFGLASSPALLASMQHLITHGSATLDNILGNHATPEPEEA